MVIFQEDGALFPWKRGPIFLLPLYGYFPGRWGSFSMEKRAHFPALFVLLFSRKIGPFFHGKYLIFYQCLSELEFRYIDNLAVGTGIHHQLIHDIIDAQPLSSINIIWFSVVIIYWHSQPKIFEHFNYDWVLSIVLPNQINVLHQLHVWLKVTEKFIKL